MDPKISAVLKASWSAAGPVLDLAKTQWHRRNADLAPIDPVTVDRELSEALALLRGEEQTAGAAVGAWVKAQLSDRPKEFDEPHVKDWLRQDRVEGLLKEAARAFILGAPLDGQRDRARTAFHDQSGDAEWYGGVLFDIAVAFLVLTLTAKLTLPDRLMAEIVKGTGRGIEEKLDEHQAAVSASFDALTREVRASGTAFPTGVVTEHLRRFVRREDRFRAMVDPTRAERIVAAARDARDGAFRPAPDAERIEVFRLAAATLARAERTQDALEWIEAAAALGADDLVPDRARVALLAGNVVEALGLLRDRHDPISVSLSLDAIRTREGRKAAVEFYRDHLSPDRLSGFGLPNVAVWTALEGDWTAADEIFAAASPAQIDENPLLLVMRARFRLAMMLPVSRRSDLVEVIGGFPQRAMLRDDHEGERLRTQALADLSAARTFAVEADQQSLRDLIDSHRLYLQLSSSLASVRQAAEAELTYRLGDPFAGVMWAALALSLDVPFEAGPLRDRLARSKRLGGLSSEELLAAAQLAMRDQDPDEILLFVDQNRERLAAEVSGEIAFGLEIEVLAKKGHLEEARKKLDQARTRLAQDTFDLLTDIIAEEGGEDGVALRLEAYEATGSHRDLHMLVRTLAQKGDPRAGDYAATLWRISHKSEDAIAACTAYFNDGADEKHEAFLAELGSVVATAPRLREYLAWSRFRSGKLVEAQAIIEGLRPDDPDRSSLRQLEINVAIESGNWHRLTGLVRQDLEGQSRRSSRQLIQAAGLAHAASDPISDELARAAVGKAPEDPHVLLAAFSLATKRGSDWEPEASGWLRRAIELSGDAGPLERRDLRDVLKLKEEGERRFIDLERMILAGEVPLSIAARPLNTTLSELLLSRLANNSGLRDARQRSCLTLISGNRIPWDIGQFHRVALDPSAIMFLHLAGLLEEALTGLPHVVLPAGTFPLLMADLERAERGQPSQTAQAARIRGMLADGRLEAFSEERGDDVDANFARAEALDAYFVHTSPIYAAGSFMEQERDATAFAHRLASPQSVVHALRRVGEINAAEEKAAVTALEGSGPHWADEPRLDLERGLVLDAVALHLLDHVCMLDRLLHRGVRLHVSSAVLEMADRSMAADRTGRALLQSIEVVRATLSKSIIDGRASFGGLRRQPRGTSGRGGPDDDFNADMTEVTPMLSLLRDGSSADLLVSGERVLNRHAEFVDEKGGRKPVATPMDVIEHLLRTGRIDPDRFAIAKRMLREAGAALIPVTADELVEMVAESDWTNGAGRGLKAICQSVHLSLARRAVALPADEPWLAALPLHFALAIRRCWATLETTEQAQAAAEYLFVNMPDVEGYATSEVGKDGTADVREQVLLAYVVLANPLGVPAERRSAFARWHEQRVERRLLGRDAKMLPGILEKLRLFVTSRDAISAGGVEISAVDFARFIVSGLPRFYRERLASDPDVRDALGLRGPTLTIAGRMVGVGTLAEFLAVTVRGDAASLSDVDGGVLADGGVDRGGGEVAIEVDGETLLLADAGLFAPDAAERLAALAKMLSGRTLAPTLTRVWRQLIAAEIPDGERFADLIEDIGRSPEAFVDRLSAGDDLDFATLVPKERRYYSNLLGIDGDPSTTAEVLTELAQGHREHGLTGDRLAALAPLAVVERLRFDRLAADLSDIEAAALALRLLEEGDPFSAVAAFELASSRVSEPACRNAAGAVLDRLLGDGTARDDLAHDFCIAALATMTAFDECSTIGDWPLSARRLAVLVHAGHAARLLGRVGIDRAAAWLQISGTMASASIIHGLSERFDDGVWIREWLIPSSISAYVVLRLAVAVTRIKVTARPSEWTERIAPLLKETPLIGIPGPMDGFDEDPSELPKTDAAEMMALLESGSPDDAIRFVLGLLCDLKPPPDPGRMIDALIVRIGSSDGELRDRLIDFGLRVAARWRIAGLADRIWELAWNVRADAHYGPAILVSLALASAAARRPREKAVERCNQLLLQIAATTPQADLPQLLGPLTTLATTAEWAEAIRLPLSIVLMGLDGRIN